jgi:hypothetical protein
VNRHQQQQRADAGRGQGRDRVNDALVQNAENEIDDEERCGDEDGRALQRCSEGLGVALKARLQREWWVQLFFNPLDGVHCLADRGTRGEIERDRGRGELALMVDDEGRIASPGMLLNNPCR